MKAAKHLTDRQADVLRHLVSVYSDGGSAFTPHDVYPTRDNQDNAARRTITTLAHKGVLQHADEYPASALVYRLNWRAADAALRDVR